MSRYTLGKINQGRNVNYVSWSKSYIFCHLCNAGPMNCKRQAKKHFNGQRHAACWRAAKRRERQEYILGCFGYRVDSLGHSLWKEHIRTLMNNYVQGEDSYFLGVHYNLLKYQLREGISLLELAIIKWSKIPSVYHHLFNGQKIVHEVIKLLVPEVRKEVFDARRITCGSEVIIPNVMKFILSGKKNRYYSDIERFLYGE